MFGLLSISLKSFQAWSMWRDRHQSSAIRLHVIQLNRERMAFSVGHSLKVLFRVMSSCMALDRNSGGNPSYCILPS